MISVFEVGNHETTQLDGRSCFAHYRFFFQKKNFTLEQDVLRGKQWIVLPQWSFYRVAAHCVVQIMYVRTMITTILTPTANTDFLLSFIRFSNSSKQPVKL